MKAGPTYQPITGIGTLWPIRVEKKTRRPCLFITFGVEYTCPCRAGHTGDIPTLMHSVSRAHDTRDFLIRIVRLVQVVTSLQS